MPGTTVGVYAGEATAGTEVSSTYEGRHITLLETELIHPFRASGFVNKGDPVIICNAAIVAQRGNAVGVALSTATALTDYIAVDTEGIWNPTVFSYDDTGGGSAIVAGDPLYIHDGSTAGVGALGTGDATISKRRNNTTQIPFGYALGAMVAAGTGQVAVKVHWDPIAHWLLDVEPLYFGDAKDVSIEWNETFLAVAIAAASKAVGIDITIAASALADGYGFIETNLNVNGASTGYTAARSDWLNLGATYVVLAGGGLITPHTDGIYQPIAASITGATIALAGKFTDQMAGADFGMYNLWNLNLTQTLTALFEVNNPALMTYAATPATGAIGSMALFHTGGGATKYIMIYSNPA